MVLQHMKISALFWEDAQVWNKPRRTINRPMGKLSFTYLHFTSLFTSTTTIVLRPFVRGYPGELVPEETYTHPPLWSSSNLFSLFSNCNVYSKTVFWLWLKLSFTIPTYLLDYRQLLLLPILRPLYRTMFISWRPWLRIAGFCWSKVLPVTCPWWSQLVHSD